MKTIKLSLLAVASVLVFSCKQNTTDTAVTDTTTPATEVASVTTPTNTTTPVLEAGVSSTTTPVNAVDAPVFTMANTIYEFGDVQAGTTTEKIVEFTNTGDSPLLITSAKASCGCTVPEYSKEPVAPGAKGTLKVSYKAPTVNGKQSKTVTLTTNTAKGTETFKIAANVVGGSEKATKPAAPVAPAGQALPAPKLQSVN